MSLGLAFLQHPSHLPALTRLALVSFPFLMGTHQCGWKMKQQQLHNPLHHLPAICFEVTQVSSMRKPKSTPLPPVMLGFERKATLQGCDHLPEQCWPGCALKASPGMLRSSLLP